MTENAKVAMAAINKWYYYAMNYNVAPVEIEDYAGKRTELLPDCLNAFPIHLREHLAKKWDTLYGLYGSRAVLMAFYGELDSNNKKLLMEWVLNNYNDEVKLNFNEED